MIGEPYEDNEDHRKYEIREIFFDNKFKMVVGTRKVLDGESKSRLDTEKYLVFGSDGLLNFSDYLSAMDTIKSGH